MEHSSPPQKSPFRESENKKSFFETKAKELAIDRQEYEKKYKRILLSMVREVKGKYPDRNPQGRLLRERSLRDNTSATYGDIIHNQIALEVEIEKLGLDPLTRVYNRGSFDKKLEEKQRAINVFLENASRRETGHSTTNPFFYILFMDLDDFKKINDSHGHAAGDHVLQNVAHTLSNLTQREDDFVARYGGEEFVILIPDQEYANALAFGEKIRVALKERPISHNGEVFHVTASIGISRCTENVQETIIQADMAMYTAKGKSIGAEQAEWDLAIQEVPPKNRVCYFDAETGRIQLSQRAS